jgi:AcrR family transcriptional regulator
MPRRGLDADAIVCAAARVADDQGFDSVSLARLAGELGIRPPSLYAHIDGLDDLRERLGARGARELGDTIGAAAAGRARSDALRAIAAAYRQYAREHPGTYAALQRARGASGQPALDVVLAVLRGYGLEGDDAIHSARAVRSALHGFVLLETGGGFGIKLPVDESFERLVAILDKGLGE